MGWEIVGHEWAVTLLSRRLAAGQVSHAYLFAGPARIGKTRLALRLAQAVNCEGAHPPCGQCRSCTRIDKGVHPDVRLVEGQGMAGGLMIDQIRELQHEAMLAPYVARHRVFILRRMDLSSVEAANSLLKTLEEPPSHVILILTALSAEVLPPTVVSRCQRLDLRRISLPEIERTLAASGASQDRARLLAHLSGGRVGWALDAQRDLSVLEHRRTVLDNLVKMLDSGRVERLAYAGELSRDGDACRDAIELWASWWRDLLLLSGGRDRLDTSKHIVNVDRLDELAGLAPHCSLDQARTALVAMRDTAEQLEANVNARLAMEGLLLKLPHVGSRVSSGRTGR